MRAPGLEPGTDELKAHRATITLRSRIGFATTRTWISSFEERCFILLNYEPHKYTKYGGVVGFEPTFSVPQTDALPPKLYSMLHPLPLGYYNRCEREKDW